MQKKLEGTMENYFGLICSNDGPLMTYPSLEGISLPSYTISVIHTRHKIFGRYPMGNYFGLILPKSINHWWQPHFWKAIPFPCYTLSKTMYHFGMFFQKRWTINAHSTPFNFPSKVFNSHASIIFGKFIWSMNYKQTYGN